MSEETTNETTTEETTEKQPSQAELELAKAVEIVEPLSRADKSDEEIAIALMTEGGFSLKKAGRLLNRALESLGVRMSSKERYELASEILLEGDFAPDEWADVVAAAEHLSEEIDATDVKQAMAAIRRFAKEREIELPKRPKGGGGARSGGGFRGQMLAWMVANPKATDDEFVEFMNANEKPEALTKKFLQLYQTARKMAVAINE